MFKCTDTHNDWGKSFLCSPYWSMNWLNSKKHMLCNILWINLKIHVGGHESRLELWVRVPSDRILVLVKGNFMDPQVAIGVRPCMYGMRTEIKAFWIKSRSTASARLSANTHLLQTHKHQKTGTGGCCSFLSTDWRTDRWTDRCYQVHYLPPSRPIMITVYHCCGLPRKGKKNISDCGSSSKT